jgi:hypothetical protein
MTCCTASRARSARRAAAGTWVKPASRDASADFGAAQLPPGSWPTFTQGTVAGRRLVRPLGPPTTGPSWRAAAESTPREPMRTAEARITLGVIAARQGDVEAAVHQGERALRAPQRSLPSLVMVSRDLTRVLKERYPSESSTNAYLDQLWAVSRVADLARHRP